MCLHQLSVHSRGAYLHHQVNEIATFKPSIAFQEGDISYARRALVQRCKPGTLHKNPAAVQALQSMSQNPL